MAYSRCCPRVFISTAAKWHCKTLRLSHLARISPEVRTPDTSVLQVTVQLAEALSWLAIPSTDGMVRLRAGSHQASHKGSGSWYCGHMIICDSTIIVNVIEFRPGYLISWIRSTRMMSLAYEGAQVYNYAPRNQI